jgi:hypothetical protein
MSNNDFEIDHIVRTKYYQEIIELLTRTLRATRVVPFEHTVGSQIPIPQHVLGATRGTYVDSIAWPIVMSKDAAAIANASP